MVKGGTSREIDALRRRLRQHPARKDPELEKLARVGDRYNRLARELAQQRQKVVGALLTADARLIAAIEAALPPQIRADYDAEAARELEPFRPRMTEGAYTQARQAVVRRRIREEHGLPEITA